MRILQIEKISYTIQDRTLFEIEHLQVHQGERIGLIGRNGSGKTTLLKMIAGKKSLDVGKITTDVSVDFVPQMKRTETTKSGGEVTQTYMQEALHTEAGLLLLDEPTTHLDTKHVEWLEKTLVGYPGTLIIVSHDRAFLNTLCTAIWEIDDGKVKTYSGNYDDYMKLTEMERNQQQLAYEKYEKKKKQLEEAIQKKEQKAQRATKKPKNLGASDARQKGAKPYFANKQKKLRKTASAFETRLEQMEKVNKPKETPNIQMDMLHDEKIIDKVIIRGEAVHGQIGKRTLWEKVDFFIRGGDKIAVIGDNGTGKTTFLKQLIGGGKGIALSSAINIGYFAQNLSLLDENKTILENVQLTSKQDETFIRIVLGRMHITNDDVHKGVRVLSGGEKVKVMLAKIFLSDVNVLVLDEPTNYLDVHSLEALEMLMKEYEGTIIFVTHDRTLIQHVATRIFHLEAGKLKVMDDTYDVYMERMNREENDVREQQRLLLETKISAVLSRLSIEPSEALEKEFEQLVKEKRKMDS